MSLLLLLMVPAILALVIYAVNKPKETKKSRSSYSWYYELPKHITFAEFVIQIFAQSLLIIAIYFASLFGSLSDIEIWNGRVASKNSEKVHCRHAYPCRPHPCMCGKNGCSTCWDICYVHGYDVDWLVHDNIGETFDISKVDSQGLKEPPDWTKVQIGEETASRHSYTNYLKYSKTSLFQKGKYGTQYAFAGYPLTIRNYFKLDRLVNPDGVAQDPDKWNLGISSVASDLGRTKQVNLVVYLTKNKDDDFFNGLEYTWFGAKKNDVVAVINVDDNNNITWADVMALVKDEYFKVKLRDDLMALKTLDREKVLSTIRENINKHYIRRPMDDFKYLLHTTKMSAGWFTFAFVLSVLLSIGLSWIMYEKDVA